MWTVEEVNKLADEMVEAWAEKHPDYKIKYPGKLITRGPNPYDEAFNYDHYHDTVNCFLYGKPTTKRLVEEDDYKNTMFIDEHQ